MKDQSICSTLAHDVDDGVANNLDTLLHVLGRNVERRDEPASKSAGKVSRKDLPQSRDKRPSCRPFVRSFVRRREHTHLKHWYTDVVNVNMSFSRHLACTRAAMLAGTLAVPDAAVVIGSVGELNSTPIICKKEETSCCCQLLSVQFL